MAEFRKREDINQELELLQTWSELGAPRLEDLSRPLSSLVRTVDPRLMEDMPPPKIDVRVSDAPPEFADLPPGDEERPRQGGLLILLALALLAAAAALFLASRWDTLMPRQAPPETPAGGLGTGEPEAAETPVATPVPSPLPSPTATPMASPSPSPSPSPTAQPSPSPTAQVSPSVREVVVPTAAPSVAPTPTERPTTAPAAAPTQRPGVSVSHVPPAQVTPQAAPTARVQPAERPAPAPGASSYVVRPGDTLSAIALAHLGDAERWPELYDLNRDRVVSPSLIRPGVALRLPGAGTGAHVRPAERRPAVGAQATSTHTVQAGESLSLLARRYLGSAARWPEIYYLNSHKIANPQWIYPGQRLAIPAGGPRAGARYVVRSGDTLWTIARRELGDATDWPAIYQANRSQIANPHWIYPGQSFLLPR